MNSVSYRDRQDFVDSTLFILVIYNCPIEQSSTFRSLHRLFSKTSHQPHFLIYDNSPVGQSFSDSEWDIHYHHNASNGGVSKAYNEGFLLGKRLEKKWLILLDQDTEFPANSLDVYLENITQHIDTNIFVPMVTSNRACISPFQLNYGRGSSFKNLLQPGIQTLKEKYFVNSGLCISLKAFELSEGYDERFPLDYSDIVFIERLTKHQSKYVLIDLECSHSLSSDFDKIYSPLVIADRFKRFCQAARLYKKESNKKVSLALIILPRAVKLSWMKKNVRFLLIAIKNMMGL